MPTYKRKVTFTREFTIEAHNARAATAKLEEEVDRVEWDADVRSEGVYPFEDEDVPCPICTAEDYDSDEHCHACDGEGYVPFETATTLKQNNQIQRAEGSSGMPG